ncbi:MAG TPA: ATP-binding protein, partial [Acidimicrobiales bacterium]|nr:ATP-binding protein [Acidimicrobiales bacterium]
MSSAIEHVSDRVPVPAAGGVDGGERIYDVVHGRLRRNAIAYTAAVTAVALVGGFFVHGESAFLVAWIYTGGAVALPALLVNWMVSRREIGGMPGGTAWSFGLIWVYVDGLALLHITARPDSPLRDLTVPAVLPAITFFAVAALQLGRRQNPAIPVVRVVVVTLTVFGVVAAVAGALVGMRVGSSGAVWLAHPAAVVAVVTTSGAVVSAWHQRGAPRRAHALNRLGVAVLALGAITSWSIVAQSLSGFTLPSSPLLVLQAVTMGLLLQIPLHAPRLVPEGAGRLATVEITSRAWFAEDPDENAVLPRRLRRPALVYVAVTAPLIGLGGLLIEGRSAFLMAWVYTSAVYTTPAMVVTWAAARRTRYQATAWRLWFLGVVALYLNGAGLLLTTVGSNHAVERLAIVAVLPCVALFGAASVAMMRARSGARALSVDVVENTMVSVVACAAVLLVVGDRIWRTDEAWFTVPAAVVTVAMTSGLTWTVTIYARMPHAHRRLETLGLVLAVVGTVDAWAMLAQGLSGFTLPSAPLLFLQAVSMGLLLLLPLYVPRTAPEGLERLPPHAQVRNGWVVVALTLAVLPVLFVQALLVQDRLPWSLVAFSVVVMELLVLAMLRQLLAIGETRRLYRLVTEAADERRRLLADVMRSVDEDRHRVASQLHDQAIFSYVAFDSMTREAVNAERVPGATVLAGVSARLRDDLAEQAESLRHLMLAVRPLEAGGAPSQARRLTSPIRAYVDSLYGDAGPPRLRVDIDDDVQLDWTTETVVLRVVQEAIGNVRRHAGAGEIAVSLVVDDGALALAVVDDGVGFDPATVAVESGLTTMRSFAALAGAALTVEARPGEGTRVLLRFG